VGTYELTPLQVAAVMKISSTDVDHILGGKLDGFTVDWMDESASRCAGDY